MENKIEKPIGFEDSLSEYGVQLTDSWCGKPIAWGFAITRRLGDEKFAELSKFGKTFCCYPNWFLITKTLTREEAIKEYGEITDEEFGPRGGWKSVTFGSTKFISDFLRPEK